MRDATVVRERVPAWSAVAYLRMAKVNAKYPRLAADARRVVGLFAVEADSRGLVDLRWRQLPPSARALIDGMVASGWLAVVSAYRCVHVVELRLPRGEPRERLEE
jgi:hypothetical protein